MLAAYVLTRKVKAIWAKALLIGLFALIPAGDLLYGRVKLQLLCKAEGGLRVNRTVENVEGFLARSAGDIWLRKLHYRFIETQNAKTFSRFTLTPSGQLEERVIDKPLSSYRLERSEDRLPPFLRVTHSIRKIDSGEILGTFVDFNYYGGWINRLISTDGPTRVANCEAGDGDIGYVQLVQAVLKPAK